MLTSSSLLLSGGSNRWFQQQACDTFVHEARRLGYIARSAFKLTHIDDKFSLFSKGTTRAVIDLGASPGGWCQVMRERCHPQCLIFGVDVIDIRAMIPNAQFLKGNFSEPATQAELMRQLAERCVVGKIDVVTSDMCPNRSGGIEDRYRIAELNASALAFALSVLRPKGHFVCKVLGSRHTFPELHKEATKWFTMVRECKPPASRETSDENFLVCLTKLEHPRETQSVEVNGRAVAVPKYGLDDWPGMMRTGRGGRGSSPGRVGGRGGHRRN